MKRKNEIHEKWPLYLIEMKNVHLFSSSYCVSKETEILFSKKKKKNSGIPLPQKEKKKKEKEEKWKWRNLTSESEKEINEKSVEMLFSLPFLEKKWPACLSLLHTYSAEKKEATSLFCYKWREFITWKWRKEGMSDEMKKRSALWRSKSNEKKNEMMKEMKWYCSTTLCLTGGHSKWLPLPPRLPGRRSGISGIAVWHGGAASWKP